MKSLFILILSIFSAALLLFLTASLSSVKAGCCIGGQCDCYSDPDCGDGGTCYDGGCCKWPDPCDGTTCGSCSGECGGGTGSVQCHDSCSNWFESCTNNDPCPPPPTPTPQSQFCKSGCGTTGCTTCCTSTSGVDPCADIQRTCSESTSCGVQTCSTTSDCPNASIQDQCGGLACSVGKQCVGGQCQYYCIGTPPCGGGGPTPTPPPGVSTCSVTLSPNPPGSMPVGSTLNFTATINSASGPVGRVDFFSSNTGVASVSPASDTTSPYQTTATGVSVGTTTISTSVVIGGVSACSDATSATAPLTVTAPVAWWQVKDADVVTNGSLTSLIPATCTLPQCSPNFDLDGAGGYPGIPTYGGSATLKSGTGPNQVSSKGWLANTTTTFRKTYDYSFFKRQIPADVSSTWTEVNESFGCTAGAPSCTINGGDFSSRGNPSASHGNYVWFHFDGSTYGNLIIGGNANIVGSRKVVLLVEGADLYLTGAIRVQSKGNGFFMAVVGKREDRTKGNVFIDPTVNHPLGQGNPSNSPDIEGIFVADGGVKTGAGDKPLYIRGAVAALNGATLERNLTDNSKTPAEFFEYAPEMMVLYPNIFTNRRIRWKEVAP